MIAELSERLAGVVTGRQRSPLYGRHSQRDWHLLDPVLEALMTQDAILGRVASILGPDLLLWRSKIFHKAPDDGVIGRHQEWGDFDGEEIGNSVPAAEPGHPRRGHLGRHRVDRPGRGDRGAAEIARRTRAGELMLDVETSRNSP